ncbi:MAG TPA: ATP-binding protein [Bacteroidales bacterium]|nr:ATP-binding protein [Bacteroidales bacterium]
MIKIAIASGKGGTGKTFISTNLFHTLSKNNNYRVTIVDCDAEAPNAVAFFESEIVRETEVTQQVPVINTDICTFCGKCHEYCNYNAIFILPPMKIIEVIEDLCHDCGACRVACKFGAITEKSVSLGQVTTFAVNGKPSLIEARINIGVMSPVTVIKSAIRQIDNQSDIAILDSPPGTSCPFVQTSASADYVILVTEPTPFGLSDLKQSVETLRIINKPFGVIINRAGLGNDSVKEYLNSENITLLLEIPFNKKIAVLYSNGKLVSEANEKFSEQLLSVFETIFKDHGNSSN